MTKLSRASGAAYGACQLGLNAAGAVLSVHLLFFYADGLGVAPAVIGGALLAAQLWNLVLNPAVGHLSDATRWRAGRRRPFLWIGAVPYGLLFAALLNPPAGVLAAHPAAWLVAVLVALFTAGALLEVPYGALLPDLTRDYDERTALAGWRQLFGTAGDVTGALVPLLGVAAFGARPAFGAFGVGLGLLIVATAAVTHRFTRESPARDEAAGPALEALASTLRSPPLRILLASTALMLLGTGLATGLFRFAIKYVFDAESYETVFFAAFFAGALGALPAWAPLVRRFGKKPMTIGLMLASAAIFLCVPLLPSGMPLAFLPGMALEGALQAGLWTVTGALLPDVVESEELRTGRRREGALLGVFGLVQKAASGLALAGLSGALAAIGWVRDAAQSPETVQRLEWLFAVGPPVLLALAALVFLRFPITRESHAAALEALAAAPPRARGGTSG